MQRIVNIGFDGIYRYNCTHRPAGRVKTAGLGRQAGPVVLGTWMIPMRKKPRLLTVALSVLAATILSQQALAVTPAGAVWLAKVRASAASRPDEAQTQALQRFRKLAELNSAAIKAFEDGKLSQCKTFLEKMLQIDPECSSAWYNLACVYGRLTKAPEALRCLNKALDYGYTDFRYMEHDDDLQSLHDTDGYRKILQRKDEIQRSRAEKILAQLRQRFGGGYLYQIDHDNRLVFATNTDRQTLTELRQYLTQYAEAQWKNLFGSRFEQYVTVVIPKEGLLDQPTIGGYYFNLQHLLMAKSIGATLTHEFTHALHASDQEAMGQEHPIWILEGLATLFETSRLKDGQAVPETNRRVIFLKRLLDRKQTIAWDKFLSMSQKQFMDQAVIAYPQCRYMMMYLNEKGLLKKWYDAYTAGFDEDSTGRKAWEKVCGKKLSAIEQDWMKWVEQLPVPPIQLSANHAYMGVRAMPMIDGLRVYQVVPGSGADKAGLKVGDILTKVNEQRVVDNDDLLDIIDAMKVGDEVSVQFRRDGRYNTVAVSLQAMPNVLPKPSEAPQNPPRASKKKAA